MAGRQFQLPLPSPSEAFFIPTGQPLFQGSLQAGFPLFGVIVHWQKRPLAAVVGHCSFFGRWMATAESYMTRNGRHMETWTGVQFGACVFCLFQDCIAACTLSIRRVQSPPHCIHWSQVSRTP